MSELPSLRVMCRRVLPLQTLGSDTFRVTLRQRVDRPITQMRFRFGACCAFQIIKAYLFIQCEQSK
jgi:hypothetical protein